MKAQEALTAAEAAERDARRRVGDEDRKEAQRKELERQLQRAKGRYDEAREQARQAEATVEDEKRRAETAEAEAIELERKAREAIAKGERATEQAEQATRAAARGLPPRLPAPGLEGEGRAAYALWLAFGPDAEPEGLIADAAAWIDRDGANERRELIEASARVRLPLRKPGASVEVGCFRDGEDLLWEASWRQPFGDQLNLFVVSEVSVARVRGNVHTGLVLRLVRPAARLAKTTFSLRPPRLPEQWIARFQVRDGGRILTLQAEPLGSGDLSGLLALISSHERRRPVILTGYDATPLARDLAGLAHVVQLEREGARTIAETLKLPSLAGSPSAAIVWPGAVPPLAGEDLSLITVRADNADPARALAERALRVVHSAAVVGLPTPSEVEEIRRRATRARLEPETARRQSAPETDSLIDDDWLTAHEQAIEDNEALHKRLAESHEQIQQLQQTVEEERKRNRAVAWSTEHTPADGDEEPEDDGGQGSHYAAVRARLDDLPAPSNCGEAVRVGVELCPHLTFAENAHETAADSPYRAPQKLLGDLVRLDRVAEMYLRGDFGSSLYEVSRELNLEWVEDSNAADHGNTAKRYRFTHDGSEWVLRPHIRVGGRAPGDGNIARIYFSLHGGDEHHERAVIVGHVGRKLPDTTT